MLVLPVAAKPVVILGGPMGPSIGAAGPTGLQGGLSLTGMTGLPGITGAMGLTGPTGLHGLASILFGMTGRTGATGSDGYHGQRGGLGSTDIIPVERTAYYENKQGLVGISPNGSAVGCKFFYTIKRSIDNSHPTKMLVLFTGVVEDDNGKPIGVSIHTGFGPAPDIGDGGYYGGDFSIYAPFSAIPFFLIFYNTYYPESSQMGVQNWYDLGVSVGTSSFDRVSGSIRNISCVILEA